MVESFIVARKIYHALPAGAFILLNARLPTVSLVVGSFGFSGRFVAFPLASSEFGMKLRDVGIKYHWGFSPTNIKTSLEPGCPSLGV